MQYANPAGNPVNAPAVYITIQQAKAIIRLKDNGWKVDLDNAMVERDGMLVAIMTADSATASGHQMTVGIHPEGSTHT